MYSFWVYSFIASLLPFAVTMKGVASFDLSKNTSAIRWRPILIIAFFLTCILRGAAYDTGTDWWAYTEYYTALMRGGHTAWGEHTEVGFQFLSEILAKYSVPIFIWYAIFHFFTYYSLLSFSRLFGFCIPFVLLIWYPFFFPMSCNIYRQYIAMSFFLVANYYLLKKQWFLSMFLGMVSVLFHTMTVVYLPLVVFVWFLFKRNVSIGCKWIMLAVSLSHVVGLSMLSLVDEFSRNLSLLFSLGNGNVYEFSSQKFLEGQYGFSYSWLFLPIHLFWIWTGSRLLSHKEMTFFPYVYYFSCIYFVLFPICHEEFLMRFALYIELFVPFMLGSLFYHCKKQKPTSLFYISLAPLLVRFVFISMTKLFENHPFETLFEHGLF